MNIVYNVVYDSEYHYSVTIRTSISFSSVNKPLLRIISIYLLTIIAENAFE